MTGETVECFNCGRSNPEWAQVCRSCGVALRHGEVRVVPTGRFPTDRDSLTSIGAVVATIVAAVLIGTFVSGLSPSDPGIVQATATPSPTVEPSIAPSVAPSVAPTEVPSPTPVPLPATLAFGSALDDNGIVSETVETFTPTVPFAYSVVMAAGTFNASVIENEIAKLGEDSEEIVLPRQGVGVDPGASSFGYVIGTARDFLGPWGPGEFEWRVYVNGEVIARGTFRFAEG